MTCSDGIDHINIYSKGKTRLGRMLSNFYRCEVETPDGTFQSVEGYWYWLLSRDDTLRTMSGWEAKKYGRKQVKAHWSHMFWFRQRIKIALSNKILYNREILDLFVESTLPFKHYYVYGEKIRYPEGGEWVIDFITTLREKLHTHVSS